MSTHDHAHPTGYKHYFVTWCWLLGMTLAALGIGYIESLPGGIKTVLLVAITLAKIFLIGSIFMHLKAERVNLVMLTFSPLVLAIILYCFTYGETRHNPTHLLENVSPSFVLPTGHHAEAGAEGKAPEGKAEEHK